MTEAGQPVQTQTLSVAAADAGSRLDRWVKRQIPGLGQAHLEKMLRTGVVQVDGGRAKSSLRLAEGQTVLLPVGAERAVPEAVVKRTAQASEYEIADLLRRVLYRDADVIAINKAPGLAVQGGTGTDHHLDGMLDSLRFDAGERPKLVHRLDRDTSGVMLLARSSAAAAKLTAAFRARQAEKTYWALTVGVPKPESGTIDVPLAKGGGRGRERMFPDEEGDAAVTDYRVVERLGRNAAWVELLPRTGRTHQIRAHLASIGTPIVGDGKYGGAAARLAGVDPGLHLHARRIVLRGPSGRMLDVTAPLPPHMAETWSYFGLDLETGATDRSPWRP